MDQMLKNSLIFIICMYVIFSGIAYSDTGVSSPSHGYLMEGVYYLINEENPDMAEGFFRKAIISSPFSTLSKENADQTYDRQVAGEAFYFLGKIYYEKAKSASEKDIDDNIARARKYLKGAEEYGIIHDKLHPPLLDEINGKYPGMDEPVSPSSSHKTEAIIEVDHESYKIDAVIIDNDLGVKEQKLSTNKEFSLEDGARYKMNIAVQEGQGNLYKALAAFGVAIIFFLTRS